MHWTYKLMGVIQIVLSFFLLYMLWSIYIKLITYGHVTISLDPPWVILLMVLLGISGVLGIFRNLYELFAKEWLLKRMGWQEQEDQTQE